MRKITKVLLFAAICVMVLAGRMPAADTQIDADTTWSGEKTIDAKVLVAKGTLTVEPGAKITFKPGGELSVRPGAALSAKGTADKPIEFIGGEKAGIILADDATVVLEHCKLTNMAGLWSDRPTFMWANCGKDGVTLRNCTITDCGGAWFTAINGPFEMTGCDLRRKEKLFEGDGGLFMLGGKNKITLDGNTLLRMTPYSAGGEGEVVIRGNIFVSCSPMNFVNGKTLCEDNYIHQPLLNGSYGLLNIKGVIRNNVVRGGTWVTSGCGGTIVGNVLEAMSPEDIKKSAEAGFKDSATHENLAGVKPGSTVERNIILNATFGAFMGAADNTCSDCLLRNNTFDLKGGTAPVWLNHMVKVNPKNIVIRNNLFLRTGRMYSESDAPDCISYTDYNLWAGASTNSPSAGAEFTSKRFVRITSKEKKEGDDGFGAHDLFTPPAGDKAFDPKAIVEDPEFILTFTDDDMLARKHTVKECLELYRKAYTPKAKSPAIDAGSPADSKDPVVKDGKCDIGAVELGGAATTQPATSQGTSTAPAK